jgi:glyoxylase-like metal-dependent hydrolase (beta-lactamase superfamily II)
MVRGVFGALAALFVVCAGESAVAQEPLRADGTQSGIRVAEVASGVYQFTASYDGYVEDTNSLVVVTRDGVLVYDTFTRPSTARAALALIRDLTNKPIRYIINSHWHPDHWTGNEVYAAAFPDVEIIATEETAQYMHNIGPGFVGLFERRHAALVAERAARTTPLAAEEDLQERIRIEMFAEVSGVRNRAYPTRTYRGQMALNFGGRQFRLRSQTGDATASTTMEMPRERIIAVGDLVVHPVTWTTNSYSVSPWLQSLREVRDANWTLLVPGHGALQRDRAYLTLIIDLFETTRTQVYDAMMGGTVFGDEVQQQIDVSAMNPRFGEHAEDFADTARRLALKFFQEYRDGSAPAR